MKFKDKTVLVTGSSRGIGKAAAIEFAKEGANVIINYTKNSEAAQDTVNEIIKFGNKAIAIQADVSKEEDVKALVEQTISEFGKLDVLVNNAGIVYDIENWSDTTIKQWEETLGVHMLGTFLCSKYTEQYLQKSKGSIVNIASVSGYFEHYPESIAYDAAKAGIISITQDLAKALSPNIRVNAVAPGWVNTDMNTELSKEYMAEQIQKIYLKRIAEPVEIAKVVAFLASEDASFITGTILRVDGGHG